MSTGREMADAPVPAAMSESFDQMIEAAVARISPFRGVARVVHVGSAGYRAVTANGEVAPPTGELVAFPAASRTMLDDVNFDLEAWFAREIAREFARAEGAGFVSGNGVNRPKGFLTAGLRSLPSGADGDFGEDAGDRLIDVVQSLHPSLRRGAAWLMNSSTLARVRRLKTDDGAMLWAPSLVAGQPATLLGWPVLESEDMPDVAPGSLSIAFGNFAEGYVIADHETRILRDAGTNKPFVHFFATKRVGGAVANADAIRLMRFSAN